MATGIFLLPAGQFCVFIGATDGVHSLIKAALPCQLLRPLSGYVRCNPYRNALCIDLKALPGHIIARSQIYTSFSAAYVDQGVKSLNKLLSPHGDAGVTRVHP
jgi:hypothetical protein